MNQHDLEKFLIGPSYSPRSQKLNNQALNQQNLIACIWLTLHIGINRFNYFIIV